LRGSVALPAGGVDNPRMDDRRPQRGIWSLAAATLLAVSSTGCSGHNAGLDIANAQCLIGTWTLTRVVDRPAIEPPWRKQGTATVTFEANGTGSARGDGVDASFMYAGRIMHQTIDASEKFTWVNHGRELSYPTDTPTLTVRGQSRTGNGVVVTRRRPENFRCNGDALTLTDTRRDNESTAHQRTAVYERR
jgi:hypothetical protein